MALLQSNLNTMSREDLIALVERQRANGQRKLTMKVAKSGGVSVYGMGKWPTTLYASQWEAVLAIADEIKGFIADNADLLARKGE